VSELIKIETIHAGQPRPYADSIYEAVITITNDELPDYDIPQKIVENIVKAAFHNFKKQDEERGWWEPYLKSIEKLDKGKWRFIIIEEYAD